MTPTIKSRNLKPKTGNTVNMGVAMPTGYIDQGEIGTGTPGVPGTIVPPAAPKLGGATIQNKLGANLATPQQGAVIPANEGKMQTMMDTSAAKIGQASGAGAKTPEQNAVDNKKYKSLLRKFGLS